MLRQPQGVALDTAGNVLVGDRWSYLVQRFAQDGRWLDQWGEYGTAPGQFGTVSALDTDADDNVWMLDKTNERIQKLSPNGEPLASWGPAGTDGTGPAAWNIVFKGGLGVGGGAVYMVDTANHRVVKYDSEGRYQGQLGTPGQAGNAPGQFASPQGVDVDGSGNVYVADNRNDRIQQFDPGGNFVRQVGSSGRNPGELNHPYDVDVDPTGDIYVADNQNNRVQKFDGASGSYERSYGEQGEGPGQLQHPRGVVVTPNPPHDVVVTDTVNDRVQIFNQGGTVRAVWGESGRENGNLVGPHGMDVDRQGNLVVADTFEEWVQVLSPSGSVVRQFGGHGGFGIEGADLVHEAGPLDVSVGRDAAIHLSDPGRNRVKHYDFDKVRGTTGGPMRGPRGVVTDPLGNVFTADTGNGAVRKINHSGGIVATWSRAGRRRLQDPEGIALDGRCGIYVADTGGDRIVQLRSTDGRYVREWGGPGTDAGRFKEPTGIDVDAASNVFVVDSGNARVQKFTPGGGFVSAWGERGHGLGQFVRPYGVVADGRGGVYVSDPFDNRVQRFDGVAGTGAEPRSPRRPVLRVTAARRPRLATVLARGIPVMTRSRGGCSVSSELTVDGATAQRLRLVPPPEPDEDGVAATPPAVVVGTGDVGIRGGRTRLVVRLKDSAKTALRRRLKPGQSVALRLRTASAWHAGAPSRSASIRVVLARPRGRSTAPRSPAE